MTCVLHNEFHLMGVLRQIKINWFVANEWRKSCNPLRQFQLTSCPGSKVFWIILISFWIWNGGGDLAKGGGGAGAVFKAGSSSYLLLLARGWNLPFVPSHSCPGRKAKGRANKASTRFRGKTSGSTSVLPEIVKNQCRMLSCKVKHHDKCFVQPMLFCLFSYLFKWQVLYTTSITDLSQSHTSVQTLHTIAVICQHFLIGSAG